MLQSPVKIGAAMALLFVAVKLVFFLADPIPESISGSILVNIFLLLLAVSVSLYAYKARQKEESNALLDIKTGLRAGLPYTVLVAAFLYAFYSWINPEYLEHQISEASVMVDQLMSDPEELARMKEQNPDFEVKSDEAIRKDLMKGPESMFSPGATSTLGLLGMLLLATLYSILCTVILRTVWKPR